MSRETTAKGGEKIWQSRPKGKIDKFEVDSPKESKEAVKNVYVSHEALKKLGNPDAVKITIEAA